MRAAGGLRRRISTDARRIPLTPAALRAAGIPESSPLDLCLFLLDEHDRRNKECQAALAVNPPKDAARKRAFLGVALKASQRTRTELARCPEAAEAVYQAIRAFLFGDTGISFQEYASLRARDRGRQTLRLKRSAKARRLRAAVRRDAATMTGSARAKAQRLKRLRRKNGRPKYPQSLDYLRKLLREEK